MSPQKLFLFLLPFALVLSLVVLFVSGRQFLLSGSCGCGSVEASPSGEFDSSEKVAVFNNQEVETLMAESISDLEAMAVDEGAVLGLRGDERWIEIDLSEQKLYAHEGTRIVYSFPVSTGKPWTPTRVGDFRIWIKLRYAKMSGGSRALGNYYYLPNVPFIQYYDGDYGLHGAYWHNNFGHTMSHGCVNLSIPDSEKLFYWTGPVLPEGRNMVMASDHNPGTRVVIHD